MVEVAQIVLSSCHRKVDWLHMPVPKDRVDEQYFEPLKDLSSSLAKSQTELVLGLVHGDDLGGTQKRIQAAAATVGSFGVSTECGLGRTPPEQLESILDISTKVATDSDGT
jgi:hypothetical protein